MARSKEQNYLHGAVILTVGVIIMKILGAIYKIPLGNMLGNEGYALFLSSYNVYGVFLTLATAGLPVALSRMISEANSQGRHLQVRRAFSVSQKAFFVLGFVCTLVMLLFPDWLAGTVLHNPDAAKSIWVLAPSVLLCCITSSYRGFSQGHGNMIPTTVGQVIEVLAKVIAGLALAWYFTSNGYDNSVSSAGAVFGVTVGSLAALIYMIVSQHRNYRYDTLAEPDVPDSDSVILKNLIRIGVPIALGSIVLSLVNLIDSSQCMGRLQNAAGFSYSEAKALYGTYGYAQTLYNLPAAFITPLTISIIPAIAMKLAGGLKDEASKISEDSLRISAAMCLPMGIGLSVLADPVIRLLYSDVHESGPMLLFTLGFASVFVCMYLMSTAVLQAAGKEKLTLISIVIGGAVKIAVNYILVGNPDINIYGAPIGTIACYFSMCAMNYVFMCRSLDKAPRLSRVLLRPVLATLIMAAVAYGVYLLMSGILAPTGRLSTALDLCVAIAAAVIAYAVFAIKLRAITAEDMTLIPKGEKIAKLLHMK